MVVNPTIFVYINRRGSFFQTPWFAYSWITFWDVKLNEFSYSCVITTRNLIKKEYPLVTIEGWNFETVVPSTSVHTSWFMLRNMFKFSLKLQSIKIATTINNIVWYSPYRLSSTPFKHVPFLNSFHNKFTTVLMLNIYKGSRWPSLVRNKTIFLPDIAFYFQN
jgi:hypothetical protein